MEFLMGQNIKIATLFILGCMYLAGCKDDTYEKKSDSTISCQSNNEPPKGSLDFNAPLSPEERRARLEFVINHTIKGREEMMDKIRSIISENGDINQIFGIEGETLLHIASGAGYAEAVRLLIEGQADVNSRDKGGRIPLHRAVQSGSVETIELLLNHGADIAQKDNTGQPALFYSTTSRAFQEVVAFLMNKGADINQPAANGHTLLGDLVPRGLLQDIEFLIAKGANVNSKGYLGYTPLHIAVEYGRPDVVKLLLEHGADGTMRNDANETPLSLAMRSDEPQAITKEKRDEVLQVLRSYQK
ncbi:MAG TPA: ankyrin repeat domain-containing protein [Anaerohalosphaeraceae bacterium]|nr:ankyrin repeat domain-containing protein [Anaerohalosphaeraceae bacterium]